MMERVTGRPPEIPVESALRELAMAVAGDPPPVVEIWDEEVAAVRMRTKDGDEALAWIHRPAGGQARLTPDVRTPAPMPDALARGLEGIASAVAAALGIR